MTSAATSTAARPLLVLLAGNPNGGKTTVFNALTGARAKVTNYPGVTVARRSARLSLGPDRVAELVDLPGAYSLAARSREEQIAADAVLGRDAPRPDAVIVVVDATTLARSLYLALQVIETGVPCVVALNVMDEARARGLEVSAEEISAGLGVPVVPMVARRGEGCAELCAAVAAATAGPGTSRGPASLDEPVAGWVAKVEEVVAASVPEGGTLGPGARRAWALWALLSLEDGDELAGIPEPLRRAVARARDEAAAAGRDLDADIVSSRFHRIDGLLARAVREGGSGRPTPTERLDRILTHRVYGGLVFAGVMLLVFQSLFAWAEPAMGLIESGIGAAQAATMALLPPGPLSELLRDGLIAGVGNVVVFVPQIALLFLFVGLMEDSGYLARVAFLIDRLMGGVGLHGRAFVPMLSGFACAIPAVMATRTIESRRDRLLTMLVLPLMSCSARLPVYVLITAAVFDPGARALGPLSTGAVVLLAMYGLSVAATLGAAAVLRRTLLRGPRPTLVLELPPYRLPTLRNLLANTWEPVKRFLVDAGTIIMALTVVLWALLSYPRSAEITERYAALRDAAVQAAPAAGSGLEERLLELESREAGEQLRHSAMGRLGHLIEPALVPFGQDWRIGVGILGAFAAREVFVSTLGIVFDISEADEESVPLRSALRSATWPDGRLLMTPLAGVSLMVFFVLACQCMSTIAVVRRESGSWRWPAFMFAYMSLLAYAAAVLVYQVGNALGWGAGSVA
jgi:ferrous iron transport protein B